MKGLEGKKEREELPSSVCHAERRLQTSLPGRKRRPIGLASHRRAACAIAYVRLAPDLEMMFCIIFGPQAREVPANRRRSGRAAKRCGLL